MLFGPRSRLPVIAGGSVACVAIAGLFITHVTAGISVQNAPTVESVFEGLSGIGWVPFLLAQVIVVATGVLPASIVGVAAGFAYGLLPGLALATISVLAGAEIAFMLSRSLLRPWIARLIRRRNRIGQLEQLVSHDGWKIACLLRASPIVPFAITSYGLGLTSMSGMAYFIGTLASLPALLGYVFAGKLAHDGLTSSNLEPLHIATFLFGIAATLALTVQIGRLVSRCGKLSGLVHSPLDPDRIEADI